MSGTHPQQTGENEGSGGGDARKQMVELMSLGGRINATHRKISKTAGTAPRMVSDAVRDDLLDAILDFVSKVGRLVGRLRTALIRSSMGVNTQTERDALSVLSRGGVRKHVVVMIWWCTWYCAVVAAGGGGTN